MANKRIAELFNRLNRKIRDRDIEYDLSRYRKTLNEIDQLQAAYAGISDAELGQCFAALGADVSARSGPADVAAASFAIIRETIRRELGLDPFDEQLLAGLAMLERNIVDMKTGEGKTLAALFPLCTMALLGKGVQALTFNDYLARRDAEWAAKLFERLGLSWAFIQENFSGEERKCAYAADVCYLTAKEFGFDYLRDGICRRATDRVQRAFDFVLIDEADSILIDEARSPLVIAGAAGGQVKHLQHIDEAVRSLDPAVHLNVEEHSRNISFAEQGIEELERRLLCGNLYSEENLELITALQYAAHAQQLLLRDRDYVVVDGQVKLVDEFTGRGARFRRWPEGLQDAVEVKEGIVPRRTAKVFSSISYHDLFRLVPGVAGMTGTAIESAQEFRRFYALRITVIPTHRRSKREDLGDRIFYSLEQKNAAIVEAISRAQNKGRPVLVGTASVGESAALADALAASSISCRLLNALNDSEEAEVVAAAGRLGAVTISTNMAGRGTDIMLGDGTAESRQEVEALGGLYVIGTSRHESERIDFQLRGRAGRQGDSGSSQFFISLDDPLFDRFGFRPLIEERMPRLADSVGENGEIDSAPLRKLILHLQKVIDGENLEIKKTLSKYSQCREKQRRHIRLQRDEILSEPLEAGRFFKATCPIKFAELATQLDEHALNEVAGAVLLSCVDRAWTDHLADLADLQSCISLRALGGRAPYLEFQREANQWFIEQLQAIQSNAEALFNALEIVDGKANLNDLGLRVPSATWTYQINDEMFDDMREALIRQPGLAAGLALYGGPLLLLFLWFNRKRRGS